MFRPALIALALVAMAPAMAQSYNGEAAPEDVKGLSYPRLLGIARSAAGGGTPIGSDYDPGSAVYRFKFIRDGRVTWIDVDGQSGEVLRVEAG